MSEESGEGNSGHAWVWALSIIILAVIAYFFVHAWLVNGVDQPDPHPLTVIDGQATQPVPQLPERKTIDGQAAPYS
ncbi:hypothetical protein AB4090_10465 [Acidithiobacillus sp. IBUN Pt1247-S3]|uniref:hypothetical protein n=1 Tax=Acidithiobacillus sp. IBUN Pt1247-S3 TaxID=3166642 RepID=UPI0034E5189E